MLYLDDTKGEYAVGATTFSVPIRPSIQIGSTKLRHSNVGSNSKEGLEPAFLLEEVAFTVYYPARTMNWNGLTNLKMGLHWILRPIRESLRGYAQFGGVSAWLIWPIIYLFGTFLKIPVFVNAPLLEPPHVLEDGHKSQSNQWPFMIFSHGLGGSRTAYSQLCSNLAASGRVVLVLEHRDGTGHACVPRSWTPDGKYTVKPKLYLRLDDVILEKSKDIINPPPLPLRTEQLTFRQHEIYIAYTRFCKMVDGEDDHRLETIDGSEICWQSWSNPGGTGPVRCKEDVTLAGHSFGGCTVLSILSTQPPSADYPGIPVSKALILDPWLEPLPTPGPSPYQLSVSPPHSTAACTALSSMENAKSTAQSSHVPHMLVINSERFTLWKDHFSRLQDVVRGWEPRGRRILTIVGAQHTSFSDFPVLPLIRGKTSRMLMQIISKLSVAFLQGRVEEELRQSATREMEAVVIGKKPDGRPKRKLIGNVGDIIIH